MHRVSETANILKTINKHKAKKITNGELVNQLCEYFDIIKNDNITQSDMKFLKYISNYAGIPHYYDLLFNTFQKNIKDYEDIGLNTFASCLYESSLYVGESVKLHKFQMEILNVFSNNNKNRFLLSSSTSFGKTYLIYEIIKKMKYNNIVLIFPTISLLSENLEKITLNNYYIKDFEIYNIHTLSQIEVNEIGEKNIFIFTPERFLSFLDNANTINIDFIFMDEIYKIDNSFMQTDGSFDENERDTAYRIALHSALKISNDILLVGPYINVSNNSNNSFEIFLTKNNFQYLDYNDINIVIQKQHNIIAYKPTAKKENLIKQLEEIIEANENAIVYCQGPSSLEKLVKELSNNNLHNICTDALFINFIKHLEKTFNKHWIVIEALKVGIGIHHGLIPKYIQKEIINLFNQGLIKILFSTTTITEGVNTSSKNILIFDSKKGTKLLKKFDTKNIMGRAGRFMYHYSGNIYILDKKLIDILQSDDEYIKHKNYDKEAIKNEIDYFITDDTYLTSEDLNQKNKIKNDIEILKIPNEVINSYKVISYSDKLKIYKLIKNSYNIKFKDQIKQLIQWHGNNQFNINKSVFDMILEHIKCIITNKQLLGLIQKNNKNEHYNLTYILANYLEKGLQGLVYYNMHNRKLDVNKSIRESSIIIFQTFKYQLVKYIGVFNIMYKFIYFTQQEMEEKSSIDTLLLKLEHNAIYPNGIKASDYGVPYKVIEYYDTIAKNKIINIDSFFDNYEKHIYNKFEKILQQK